VAGTRYKLDDFRPYIYRTDDFGKTWKKITTGIDNKHFTRVVRADVDRPGLLYAGTESGLYISFDDGENWDAFDCNLPMVPITDLAIKEKDLIVATQGRAFWMLDDLSVVQQWKPEIAKENLHVFDARPTYRMRGGGGFESRTAGTNISGGVNLKFHMANELSDQQVARVEIHDPTGNIARVFSSKPEKSKKESKLDVEAGMNTLRWNMRYNGADSFDGMVLWGGGTAGPMAVPGEYTVKFSIVEKAKNEEGSNEEDAGQTVVASAESQFTILKDPRSNATEADLQDQFDFLIGIRDKLSETHKSIKRLRDVKQQIQALTKRLKDKDQYESVVEGGKEVVTKLSEIEKVLYQTKNQAPQDPLNFPIRLNNRLSALVSVVSGGDNRHPADR
jgi:hypothetical protein